MSDNTKAGEVPTWGPEVTRIGRDEMAKVQGGVTAEFATNSLQCLTISNVMKNRHDAAKNALQH